VRIRAGTLSQCTLTIYPLALRAALSLGGHQQTRLLELSERIDANGDPAAADPGQQLCQDTFRIGLVSSSGLAQKSPPTPLCPGASPRGLLPSGVVLYAEVMAVPSRDGALRYGLTESFDSRDYLATYSDGCSRDSAGVVEFASAPGQILTCTVTHTFVRSAIDPTTGLLDVTSHAVGPDASVCPALLTVQLAPRRATRPTETVTSGAELASSCAGPGGMTGTPEPTGDAELAVGRGVATLSAAGRAGTRLGAGVVFGGDCSAAGQVSIRAGERSQCSLTLVPLSGSLALGGAHGTPRLITVTERVGVGALNGPPPGQLLCRTHYRLGIASSAGRFILSSDPLGACGSFANRVNQSLDVSQSSVTSIELAVPAVARDESYALSDDFNAAGYMTTYSDGCLRTVGPVAALQAPANPLSCTITHTYVGATTRADDSVIHLDGALVGPGSLCDARLELQDRSLPSSRSTTTTTDVSFPCRQGQRSVAIDVPVLSGKLTLAAVPRSGRRLDYGSVFGGDCASDGTLRLRRGALARCTLTLYGLLDSFVLGGSHGAPLDTVLISEQVAPNDSRQAAAAAQALCATSFQLGLVSADRLTNKTPAVKACAQQSGVATAGADGSASALTSLAVSYGSPRGSPSELAISDSFDAPDFTTTYSTGCRALTGGLVAAFDVNNHDPLICTITHTYTGPPAPPTPPAPPPAPPTPASTTSVACPVAGSAAAVDGTMVCSITVSAPSGAPVPSGTVTVSPGGETCNIASDPCQVTVSTGTSAGSQETVSASFPGQSGLTASSGSATVTLTLRATSIAMACKSASAPQDGTTYNDQPIDCTLTVSDQADPTSFSPGGQASATAGTDTEHCTLTAPTNSCTVTLTSSGLWTSPLTVTSTYPGDGTEFAASTGSEPMTVLLG
jgi:hypothetical protein